MSWDMSWMFVAAKGEPAYGSPPEASSAVGAGRNEGGEKRVIKEW